MATEHVYFALAQMTVEQSFTAAWGVIEHKLVLEMDLDCRSAVAWMKSYLANRSQRVFLKDSYSASVPVNCGLIYIYMNTK